MAVFAPPASGHDWMYPFQWRREGKPVTMFTSSDYGELERAARLLRVIPFLRHSRVLVFMPLRGTPPACSPEEIKSRLGVEVVVVPQQRLDEMMDAVNPDKAQAEAEQWIGGAEQVVLYGDHLQSARHLADLMKMQVVEEG